MPGKKTKQPVQKQKVRTRQNHDRSTAAEAINRKATKASRLLYSREISTLQIKPKQAVRAKNNITMQPCTAKFALACSDPFAPAARGACIPYGTTETQKTHAFARFDFQTSSQPSYILVCPTVANDLPICYVSGATSTTTNATPLNANNTLNTGWTRVTHNGPYSAGQLVKNSGMSQATARIVSVGLRVQYVGSMTNESGLFYCLHHPTHENISGAEPTSIGSLAVSDIGAVSRQPCTLVIHPIEETEFVMIASSTPDPTHCAQMYPYSNGESYFNSTIANTAGPGYTGGSYTDTVSGYTVGQPVGVICISGVPANTSIHAELIIHLEFAGKLPGPNCTPVASDIQGANKVAKAALTVPIRKQDDPMRDKSMWTHMHEALNEVWHEAKPILVPAAIGALSSLL